VTGGASGLGESCVRELVSQGAKVAILDLSEDRGKNLASELGGACFFHKTDVTDENSVKSAIAATMERFRSIHIAVNCAGVATPAKVLGKRSRGNICKHGEEPRESHHNAKNGVIRGK